MNQKECNTKKKKWKHLSERERYDIETLFKENYSVNKIAKILSRDRRTIERELDKGMQMKMIENPYLSRNTKVPDYIETYYSAEKAQEKADSKKKFKGRYVKIMNDKELLAHLEKRIGKDNFSP